MWQPCAACAANHHACELREAGTHACLRCYQKHLGCSYMKAWRAFPTKPGPLPGSYSQVHHQTPNPSPIPPLLSSGPSNNVGMSDSDSDSIRSSASSSSDSKVDYEALRRETAALALEQNAANTFNSMYLLINDIGSSAGDSSPTAGQECQKRARSLLHRTLRLERIFHKVSGGGGI
ncbi:hypothetical protein C8R44DRAFT_860577 [Mycena epipterygia]|nr:hypothetical protein C8R44DRAFT_860577 [Mycena epipterygia]